MKKKVKIDAFYENGIVKLWRIMRLTFFILLVSLLKVSASVYSQQTKLSIELNNVTLEDVFEEIEDNSNFVFFYNAQQVELDEIVSIDVSNKRIEEILNELLKKENIAYKLIDRRIVLYPKDSQKDLENQQQPISVSGKVINEDGSPIPGVTVLVKGTMKGSVTDFDGNYNLLGVPSDATLVFSFIGFRSLEVDVNDRTFIRVTLLEETIGIEEVVAIGYGVQKKSDITGAVSSVSSDELSKIVTSTPVQALQGKAAGVSIVMESGSPDAAATVKIRGVGTMNNTDPLYVVDGLPMSSIDYLNTNDIESIEILKDASACAIYGSRGANGVVLVSTKKGKEGALNVNFNAYYGVESLFNSSDMLSSEEYATLSNQAYSNAGLEAPYSSTSNLAYDTNWYDEVSRVGTVENYNLSFSGGGERISSFLSGNYFSRKGIIKSTDFEKMNFIQNTTIQATDFFKIETSISGTFTKNKRLDPASIFVSSLIAPPDVPVINPETGYYAGINKLRLANPLGRIDRNNELYNTTDLVGNVTASLNITKDLVYKSVFGIRYQKGTGSGFDPVYYETADISTSISTVSRSASKLTDWTWDNILTYTKKFNDKHELTVMGAISSREYNSDSFFASKQNVTFEDEEFWYFDAATDNPQNNGSGASLSMLSYLGRVNYNYQNRYLVTASFRADGSSRFLDSNRTGYFPSGALAWKLSEEDFFKSLEQNVFSSVKLRVGYGQIGNERINSYYPYLTPISQQQYYTTGVGQARVNGSGTASLGNPDVQWETSTQSNVGLDLTLLEGKLSTTIDYYVRKTDNILLSQQVPRISGSGSITRNVGGMENKGFELAVSYKNSKGDLKYDISANVATVKNEVTNLGTTDALISTFAYDYTLIDFQGAFGSIIRSEVGEPYGQFYGWVTDGIFQSPQEVDDYVHEGQKIQPNAVPGDFKFKDLNNDGRIDDSDKDFIGNPIPDLTFGLSFNASYKKFDFSMFLQGQAGNEIYNASKYYFARFDGRQNVKAEFLEKYWTADNNSNSQPAVTKSDARNDANYRNSDYYIENGSYLRLKNIQVGYNFSPVIAEGFKPACRLYLSAQNLITITGYSGSEPEISGLGVDRGVYPQSTSFMIGTVINF